MFGALVLGSGLVYWDQTLKESLLTFQEAEKVLISYGIRMKAQ